MIKINDGSCQPSWRQQERDPHSDMDRVLDLILITQVLDVSDDDNTDCDLDQYYCSEDQVILS